jgi:hypothetical protein
MKNIKSYIAWMVMAVASLGTFTACQDDIDAPADVAPVATLKANTTIAELKEAFWQDATNYIDTIGTKADGSHYIISGRVTSSDEAGNCFKYIILQDETGSLSFSINSYNLYLSYRRGQEIVVDLTGMYIGKYAGLMQVGMPSWYANGDTWQASFMAPEFFSMHKELNGWPDRAKIDTIQVNKFSELSTNPEGLRKWQSQIVRFNNVSFQNGGTATFSEYKSSGVDQKIVDADGSTLNVRTSGYSNFWNKTLPTGSFDLVAILSFYNSAWQLTLIDYAGCMNIGHPTVPKGTETNPWSVDEAIALEQGTTTNSGWVTGYIVGAVAPEVTSVTSNSDIEWTSTPVLNNTLVIGQTADTKDIANAIVISLPAGSKLQEVGNLVSNPSNYGKQIWVSGTLAKYMDTYGVTGNNGTASEFKIDGVDNGGDVTPTEGNGTEESPYTVEQIIAKNPTSTSVAVETGIWVSGYIVGWADMSSTYYINSETARFSVPATLATNILLASDPSCTDVSKCIGIQLPSGTTVRSALNLMDNPGNLGKKVELKGDIYKYSGVPGIKNTSEYKLNDNTGTGGGTDNPSTGTGTGTEDSPYSVAEIIAKAPSSTSVAVETGVWTKGYIVGWADMSSTYYINATTATFSVPATLATNILLADDASCTDWSKCIGIQLPSGTTVRTALNLMDNPANLGKLVEVKGDIYKYSGVPGIKNTSAYKFADGSTPGTTPTTPTEAVTSLNTTFEGSTALPTGWTQKQVAGAKTWQIKTYNNNNYASMSGYGSSVAIDSWLISPAINMSGVTNKVLTFQTQGRSYGATGTDFEVYVLTSADPSTATKTKINCTLATLPTDAFSDWTSSGNVDLSSYTGTIYIGFRYNAAASDNYPTWCVDNILLNDSAASARRRR